VRRFVLPVGGTVMSRHGAPAYPVGATTLLMLLIFAPTVAQAHLIATGMGPVFDGISHFALSPEDFLPVIALGFFAGLRGARHTRTLSWAIPLAWLAGGLLAMANVTPPGIVSSATAAVLFLLVGGLLAANVGVSMAMCSAVGGLLGLSRGLADFAQVMAGCAHFLMLLGICATIFVAFAISASVTLPLERPWMIVAARVCGSWLAALGLLMSGWIWRYGAVI
jgi:urease accessory protein